MEAGLFDTTRLGSFKSVFSLAFEIICKACCLNVLGIITLKLKLDDTTAISSLQVSTLKPLGNFSQNIILFTNFYHSNCDVSAYKVVQQK